MGIEVRNAQLSTDVLRYNLTNEGGVDGTYRLLKNIIGLWLVQQCKRSFETKGKRVGYAELVQLAKRARPLRSLIDPDDARFLNPTDMPLAIQDFCRKTGQPIPGSEGELVRCALESLALRYNTMLDCLEKIGGKRIEVIHIVGGGSKNDLLNQFTADACGRPVVAGPVEATVLGNVLTQARASGEIGSLSELRTVVRQSCEVRMFEPKSSRAAAWVDARGRFERITAKG
jgi:rhamnulokinase